MTEIVKFINGSDEVDLLTVGSGVRLIGWEFSLPDFKESRTASIIFESDYLTLRFLANSTHSMSVAAYGVGQNDATASLRRLVGILQKGVNKYVGKSDDYTYLMVQTNQETIPIYLTLKSFKLPKTTQIIGDTPFSTGVLVDGNQYSSGHNQLDLALEFGVGREFPIGQNSPIDMYTVATFDGRNYGTINSAGATVETDEVFVNNKHSMANISHMYHYDSSSTTFSSNLVTASLPYNLLPSPLGVGDILYVGIRSTITNGGPFNGFVLNIGTPAATEMVGEWEYWNDPLTDWFELEVVDQTETFTMAGSNIVWFYTEAEWKPTIVNGFTAYWVRFRITGLNSNTVVPTQTTRRPYFPSWPYLDIEDDQVGGDVPALMQLIIEPVFKSNVIDHTICGLKSGEDSVNFYPHLNISDEQLPTGITVDPEGWLFEDDPQAPTGRSLDVTATASTPDQVVAEISIDSSLYGAYKGRYRAIFNIYLNSAGASPKVTDIEFYLNIKAGGAIISTTEPKNIASTTSTHPEYIDLGEINLVAPIHGFDVPFDLELFATVNGANNITFFPWAIILIPTDEWSMDSSTPLNGTVYLQASGDLETTTVITRRISNDSLLSIGTLNTIQLPILKNGTKQRLVILNIYRSETERNAPISKVRISRVNRYLINSGE